jgi:5-methylcytosine-specific restriction endonuclease McrA
VSINDNIQRNSKRKFEMPNERDPVKRQNFPEKQGLKRAPRGQEVYHIIPLEDGGRDSMANMQLLTKEEHLKKTTRENKARAKKNK